MMASVWNRSRSSRIEFTAMTSPPDPLVDRLRRQDSSALGEYLNQQRRPLLAFIDKNLGPRLRGKVELQDIFQDLSLSAWNSLASTDLAERDPFNWLCHLAEQRIIDAHRKFFGAQKRAGDREQPLHAKAGADASRELVDLLVASMTTASQAFSRDQKQLRLNAALADLADDSREALRLRYVDGLPTKLIAQKLGKSDGAIRVLLTRSLQRLQHILGSDVPS
jgi:RNA polymerase sigma-70 factor (ECF subfamily)